MAFRNSILAGEELVRSGMRSPDYLPATAGWRVGRDGTAEFNNVLVRGTFSTGVAPADRIVIDDTIGPRIRFFDSGLAEPGMVFATHDDPGDGQLHGLVNLFPPGPVATPNPSFKMWSEGDTGGASRAALQVERLFIGSSPATDPDLLGPWADWVPVLGGAGWSLGTTGSIAAGAFWQLGRLVHFIAILQFGTVGATFGAAQPWITIPQPARNGFGQVNGNIQVGYWDATGLFYVGTCQPLTASTLSLEVVQVVGAYTVHVPISNVVPITFAPSDRIFVAGTYEAA